MAKKIIQTKEQYGFESAVRHAEELKATQSEILRNEQALSDLQERMAKRKKAGQKAHHMQLTQEKATQELIVNLKRKVPILERQTRQETTQQLKNRKASAQYEAETIKAEKQHQNISQDLNKSIFKRIGSAGILKGLSFVTGQNLKTQLSQTTELKRHTADLVKEITTESEFLKFNAKDRATMIDLSKGLADGTYDEIDARETLQNLSEDGLKVIEQQEDGIEQQMAFFKPIAVMKKEEVAAGERAEKIEEEKAKWAGVNKKLNLGIAAAFALGLKIATKFAEILDGIGKQFGSLNVMGPQFQKDLMASSVEAQKLGGGMEDVAAITSTLASNFGMNVDEAAELSSKVFDTSKAIGLSADEGANLFGVLMQTANLSADQAEDLAEGAFQLARQAGVAPAQVMKDIASSTDAIANFTKDGGNNIAEAAVQARQMGVSLDTTAKVAEGLLDFQSSIGKEIEASVLIGRQLNFQRARELALSGDIAGATKEIVGQLGDESDFNALNLIQRKALADSIGVSVGELSKMVSATDKLTLSGALAAGSFDDLTGQEALSNLSSITNEFKALMSEALIVIGPEIENLAEKFRDWLDESGGVAYLKETFFGLVNTIKNLISYLPVVIALFATMKAAAIGVAIAQSMAALTKGGMTMGLPGILLTAAALGTTFLGLKSLMSFDDLDMLKGAMVKGGPSTKAVAQIQGGEGVFQEKGLQEMFGGFGTQNAYQRSFGLTSADAEMIGTAMASKISLKTDIKSGNLQVAMDTAINPMAGTSLIRDF
jgi:hypothetical protein